MEKLLVGRKTQRLNHYFYSKTN